MNEFITLFQQILRQVEENIDSLSQEEITAVNEFIQNATAFIQQGQGNVPGGAAVPGPTPTPPVQPPGADLLWVLAGGQPEAFAQYLSNFPNAALNAIVRNPGQLNQLVARLSREMPRGEPAVADSIPHAPLQSSNVWGFSHNPKNGDLFVRFNNGSVYGYEGVPLPVFKIFASGAIPAKTSGQNSFGRWWRGKSPSLGSAFHQLIKLGGYPYQKLK